MIFHSRDVCAIIADIEKAYETRNFAPIPGLVLELQILSSRIENYVSLERKYKVYLSECQRLGERRQNLRFALGEAKKDLEEILKAHTGDDLVSVKVRATIKKVEEIQHNLPPIESWISMMEDD